jgi:Zn-dependent protease with chaperone function
MSELDFESFLFQKTELDGDGVTKFTELASTHPYMVNRIHALREFIDSPLYAQLSMQA